MKFYHGSNIKNLQFQPHIKSRYGFTVIFATSDKNLAIKYAFYNFKKYDSGYLYSFEVNEAPKNIDFNAGITHSITFRNLIYKLQKSNEKLVLINNAIDYPSEELAIYKITSIIAIFDLTLISNLKMIGKY